jgi:hypothetical protein
VILLLWIFYSNHRLCQFHYSKKIYGNIVSITSTKYKNKNKNKKHKTNSQPIYTDFVIE